jgi:subtilase family serine protease
MMKRTNSLLTIAFAIMIVIANVAYAQWDGYFIIPTKTITIDGNISDWNSLQPVFVDDVNDQDPGADFNGTDLHKLYIAKDSSFLYIMMTLYDGNPIVTDNHTLYLFETMQIPYQLHTSGDRMINASCAYGQLGVTVTDRGQTDQLIYPDSHVGIGTKCIEWKAPLSDVGQLSGRYVRAYIHVVGPGVEPVSDDNTTGIQLIDQGGYISGKVTSASGQAIGNVCVVAGNQCGELHAMTTTDQNGNYSVTLPVGDHYISTFSSCNSPHDYIDEWWNDAGGTVNCNESVPVTVTSGETKQHINFSLNEFNPTPMTVNPDIVTVGVGETALITINDGNMPYSVSSGDVSIAAVSLDAATVTVTGVEEGEVTITISDFTATDVSAKVTVTPSGPKILSHTPSGSVVPPVDHIDIYFSEKADPATFTAEDISMTGPAGDIVPDSLENLDDTNFRIGFPEQRLGGIYQLVIGPHISDMNGNEMDQDEDSTQGEAEEDQYLAVFSIIPGLQITAHTPTGDQTEPVSEVTITFNKEIQKDTFTAEDITISGPLGNIEVVSGPTLTEPDTYKITFTKQEYPGDYHVYIAPEIMASDGTSVDQDGDGIHSESEEDRYDAGFVILDVAGPRVVSQEPSGSVMPPVDSVDIIFNEPTDAASFDVSDISVTGPNGTIVPESLTSVDEKTFHVSFSSQSEEGDYEIRIVPEVSDIEGNLMDQDKDKVNGETSDDVYIGGFTIDSTGPKITAYSTELRFADITFNEDIDPAAFTVEQVSVTAPDGETFQPLNVGRAGDFHVYRIGLPPPEQSGTYHMTIASTVTDMAGNEMDQDEDGDAGETEDDQFTFEFGQDLPDLVISEISYPSEVRGGQEIEVTWIVSNSGAGQADGQWTDTVYISKDAQLDYEDDNAGQFQYDQPLKAGESYTRAVTITAPEGIEEQWWIIVKTDTDEELDEQGGENNTKIAEPPLWITSRPYPDLQITEILIPDTLPKGEKATISWTVRNLGTGPTSAAYWYDELYLSLDNKYDESDDIRLESIRNADFLAPGEPYTQTEDISIPSTISEDEVYYILIRTDAEDEVEEYDLEDNNIGQSDHASDIVVPPPAHLTVTNIEVSDQEVIRDQKITVTWTVKNTGGTTVDNLHLDHGIVMSKDDFLDPSDGEKYFHLGGWEGRYEPGTEYTVSDSICIFNKDLGEYYLILWPDPSLKTGLDKTVMAVPITIALKDSLPDLRINSIDFSPVIIKSGEEIEVNLTVENAGEGLLIGNSKFHCILSEDRILDEKDMLIGDSDLGDWQAKPGEVKENSEKFKIPKYIEGEYYVFVEIDTSNRIYESDETNNVLLSDAPLHIELLKSDLQVQSATAPLNAVAGQQITIEWTVANTGIHSTLPGQCRYPFHYCIEDSIYLSLDETLEKKRDIIIGSNSHLEIINPQMTYTQSRNWILRDNLIGKYYIFIVTDAGDYLYEHNGEDNNVFRIPSPIEITNLAPDLEVVSFTAPNSGIAGATIIVDWSVSNSGEDTAQTIWQDAVYLSKDDVFDKETDSLIDTFERSDSLNAGSSYTAPATPLEIRLPELSDHEEGTYYLFFISDKDNSVYEKDSETNNISSPQPIMLTERAPDLQVQSASAPEQGVSGRFFRMEWTIENNGDAVAKLPWKDAVYLSQDKEFDKDEDRLIAHFEHTDPLDTDQISGPPADSMMVLLPERIEGTYYLFVSADDENTVYEKDKEDNNLFLIPQPIEISYSPADLQVRLVEAPVSSKAGAGVTVSWTVKNRGDRPTDESFWYDGVYLSSDDNFDPASDIELGILSHTDSLLPGASYSASESFVPRQDVEGSYYVYVATDVRRQVYEHDKEDNNIRSAPLKIRINGVRTDLEMTSLIIPDAGDAGNAIQIEWTVLNKGIHATLPSSWEDAIYLSGDGELDDEKDWRLEIVKHNGILGSGETYTQTWRLKLPEVHAGDFFIIVKTDAASANDVYEYEAEDNNTLSEPLEISLSPTPDLQVTDITSSETAWSGQYMPLEWMVANLGSAAAISEEGSWFDNLYLSRDQYLDIENDIPLGNLEYHGELSEVDGTYTHRLDVRLPRGASGPYYAVAFTDSSTPDRVFERDMEGNNDLVSETPVEISLSPPSDLQIVSITPPASGIIGETGEWRYVVTNAGTLSAVGEWYDTLYLSENQEWDIDDKRIGRILHEGDLEAGETYTGVLSSDIPAVLPGDYYVIARTDILDDVRETDDTNNTACSAETMTIEAYDLTTDQSARGELAADQSLYYQLETSAGDDLLITFGGDASDCAEVFVAHARIPTRSDFDFRAESNDSEDGKISIPGTKAGFYYILVYGYDCGEAEVPFEISASVLTDLAIRELSVNQGSNSGTVTTHITGTKFSPEIEARLEDDGKNVVASGTVVYDNTQSLSASFDLTELSLGDYQIVLENPDDASATERFNVIEGEYGGLFTRLLIPTLVRPGRPYTMTLEYGNNGSTDIPASLVTVSADEGILMRLSSDEEFHDSPIQVLCIGENNPVDVLPPGEVYSIEMEFKLTEPGNFSFYLKITDKPDEPINWADVEDSLRPEDTDPETWDPMWENLQSQLGDTWGSYVQALRENALRLGMRGERTYDVRELFALAVYVAYGGSRGAIVGYVFDNESGSTVSGATITAFQPDGSGFSTAATENDGSFILDGLPPGKYTLEVEGYIIAENSEAEVPDGKDAFNHDVYVIRGAEISGYVSENTTPLEDIPVLLRSETTDYSAVARTDDLGKYQISGLPADTYTVSTLADEYVNESVSGLSLNQGTIRNDVHFYLDKGGVITGTVTSADGLPVEGASVIATESEKGYVRLPKTDEDGYYEVKGLPGGVYSVKVRADAYVPSGKEEVNLNEGGNVNGIDIQLEQGAGVIGRVTDGANPISGASVFFQGDEDSQAAITEEDGSFSINSLASGVYYVLTSANGYCMTQQMIKVPHNGVLRGLNITLHRGAKVSGVVTGKDASTPVAEALVEVHRANGTVGTTITDSEGSYEFGVVPLGSYSITVKHAELCFVPRQIEIQNYSDITADFTAASSSITGKVTSAGTGSPVGNAKITAILKDQEETYNQLVIQTETDASGLYAFDSLVPGDYLVVVSADGFGRQLKDASIDTSFQLNFDLPASLTLTGTVSNSEANPLPSVTLRIIHTDWEENDPGIITDTDESGTYSASGITAGDYLVVVQAEGYTGLQESMTISENTGKNFSLGISENRISGIVVEDATGLPIDEGFVVLENGSFIPIFAELQAGGLFSVNLPALGEWDFTAFCMGTEVHQKISVQHNADAILRCTLSLLIGSDEEAGITDQRTYSSFRSDSDFGNISQSEFTAKSNSFRKLWCPEAEEKAKQVRDYQMLLEDAKRDLETEKRLRIRNAISTVSKTTGIVISIPIIVKGITIVTGFAAVYAAEAKLITFTTGILFSFKKMMERRPDGLATATSLKDTLQDAYDLKGMIPINNKGVKRIDKLISKLMSAADDAILLGDNENNIKAYSKLADHYSRMIAELEIRRKLALRDCQLKCFVDCISDCVPPGCHKMCSEKCGMPPEPDGETKEAGRLNGTGSHDPNDKLISVGYGTLSHITSDQTIEYTIRFENDKEAEAAAQLITVTDPLSENLDWGTFEVGDMEFSNHHIQVPQGLSYYYTRVDLRPEGNDLFVDIEGSIDPGTGVVTWTFTGIDPETGELTEDALDGFLPPNGDNHEGEGYVKFRIRPRTNLEDGVRIDNIATIIFDWNEPIDTPPIFNTIDTESPTSQVSALPSKSNAIFEVRWTGKDSDNGSGIAAYDIYVSKDEGDYELWMNDTTATSGIFTGTIGNTYSFYSVATDHVGHTESAPDKADAATTVTYKVEIGDIDNNGVIDLNDAILYLETLTQTGEDTLYLDADLNGDGKLGLEELIYVLQLTSIISGDIDNSGTVELSDAILALQVLTDTDERNLYIYADVNADNKIGVEEAVYVLQVLSELK